MISKDQDLIAGEKHTLVHVEHPSSHAKAGRVVVPQPIVRRASRWHAWSVGFITVLLIVTLVLLGNRYVALAQLIDQDDHANQTIGQVFINTTWPKYEISLSSSEVLETNPLYHRLLMRSFYDDVRYQTRGLNIVKATIYNLDGLAIFSTDPREVGKNIGDVPGFHRAKAGQNNATISSHDHLAAFIHAKLDSVLSSYIPLPANHSGQTLGVFKVESNLTDALWQFNKKQLRLTAGVLGTCILLYLIAFLFSNWEGSWCQVLLQKYTRKTRAGLMPDPVTGLPNRKAITERLESLIEQAKERDTRFTILFVDLDRLKDINDTFGHHMGDVLLQTAGERLTHCAEEIDMVARLGGDEFLVLLPGVDSVSDAARIAQKARNTILAEPCYAEGREIKVNASIGIAMYPNDGETAVTLIKHAGVAMYYAKEMGRNNYQFYAQEMNARAFSVLSMEFSLQQALERNEFRLHYQPRLEIATGRIVGAEVLIRWQHPQLGMVAPSQFIPIAEERGLIVDIGDWALQEACRQSAAWQSTGLRMIPVGVNVSATQFLQEEFPAKVAAALRESGLAPQCLELELTENVLMQETKTSVETLRVLKDMGLSLSIDDFGTGYSSLSYLKQFPIDKLKLDQSFVKGLPTDSDDIAICTAVLRMAKAMKLKVIAEGVETPEQLEFLRSRKCDEIQGYYFSKPLPAEEFFRLVRQQDALYAETEKKDAQNTTATPTFIPWKPPVISIAR